MRFILVRHCETDWNKAKCLQGHTDIELNEKGHDHAKDLVKGIESFCISRIVSSDLKRATQTADILNSHLRVPVLLDRRLRECNFGKFEGMTWLEVEKTFNVSKESYYQGADKFYDFRSVGGENKSDVAKRHLELISGPVELYPNQRVLLLGHGTGLNTLLDMLGHPVGLKRGKYREIDYL